MRSQIFNTKAYMGQRHSTSFMVNLRHITSLHLDDRGVLPYHCFTEEKIDTCGYGLGFLRKIKSKK